MDRTPAASPTGTLPHRPALDGLRALAVVAVLLFHGGVKQLPGGFLGVDVFFVLSGFLITSLMLGEYQASGRLDLAAFWWRRARRLLPALFAVIVFVAWYAATRAPDLLHARLRGDLFSVLFYVANWRFIVEDVSYFERFVDPNPLLHTWSLAIEEQFYLFWPLLFLLVVGPIRRRFGARAFPAVIGALIVLSVVVMVVLQLRGTSLNRLYYGTDTRAHSLLVGALAGRLATRRGWWAGSREAVPQSPPRWLSLGAPTALVLLIAAFVVVGEASTVLYRGGFLVIALLSAVLVLAMAHPSPGLLGDGFASAPARWVGERSYGIYLWHWPLYVLLTPERVGMEGPALLALRIAVTFAMAALSYAVLEVPARRWRPAGRARPSAPVALGGFGATLAALAAVIVVTTIPRPAAASADAALPPLAMPSGAPVSVFLVGDSVAYGLHTQHRPDPRLNLTVAGSTRLGCMTMVGGTIVVDGRPREEPAFCASWPETLRTVAPAKRRDVSVIMLGNGELFDHLIDGTAYPFGSDAYRTRLTQWMDGTFGVLRPISTRLAMTTVPCYKKPDFGVDGAPGVVNRGDRQPWLNAFIREYASAHGVEVFDLASAVCPNGRFVDRIDGVRMRADGVHFTENGAQWVWRWLAPQLRTQS